MNKNSKFNLFSAPSLRAWLFLLFATGCGAGTLSAQEIEVSTEIQLKFLSRILTYDRGLADRADNQGHIVVVVIYQEKYWASNSMKKEIEALSASGIYVNNYRLTFKMLAVTENIDPAKLPGRSEASIYLITPLRGVQLSTLFQKSTQEKILTYAAVPAYCNRGASVSVELKGESPGIVINLTSSQAEGCNFSAQLLKVARIIK